MRQGRIWRCDLVLEAQEENRSEGPVFSRHRGSERQFVVRDDHRLVERRLASLARRILDVESIRISGVLMLPRVERFGRPVCRYAEWDGDRQTGVGSRLGTERATMPGLFAPRRFGHDLPPRRCLALRSARSLASLAR